MDFKRENNTPRDRIDEDMLRRILSEDYGVRDASPRHLNDDNDYPIYRRQNNSSVRGNNQRRDNRDDRVRATSTRNSSCCPICGCAGGCSCGSRGNKNCNTRGRFKAPRLEDVPLSMVYSPAQEWRNLHEPEVGFERGTIFRELDFPWYPTSCPSSGCKSSGCRNR